MRLPEVYKYNVLWAVWVRSHLFLLPSPSQSMLRQVLPCACAVYTYRLLHVSRVSLAYKSPPRDVFFTITGNVDCRKALLTNEQVRLEGVSLGPLIAPAVVVLTIRCFLLGEGCNSRLFSPVVGPGDGTTDYI